MESGDDAQFSGPDDTDIGSYMLTNASAWYGFTPGTFGINAADLAVYMDWPGFVTGTTSQPGVIQIDVPQTSGGNDDFGNPIEQYKFETTEVTGGTISGSIVYSVWVPSSLINSQVYSTVGINYNNAPNSLVNTSTDGSIYVYDVIYTGPNWFNTTYKVFTNAAPGGGWINGSAFTVDNTNNYFRGGTLI
jgi:hypothetical protein